MGSALWIAISGLNANSRQMDVIGNNITNSNTMGFKSGKTYFANVLSQSLTGGASGAMQIGQGVMIADIATQFTQGSLESTGSATDLAIDGDGFFVVEDSEGSEFFTRAGAFHIDNEGYLVDVNNNRVQGYTMVNGTRGPIGDINVQNVHSAPEASTTFSVGQNLDSRAATGETFASSVTVYDTLGAAHTLTINYTKAGANNWNFAANLDGTAATAPSATALAFNGNGELTSPAADVTFTFTGLPNGATIGNAGVVTWDLVGTTAETVTGYASASTVKSLQSDGYASGVLRSMSIDKDGMINGFFTNGQTAALAELVLASFPNPWGLKKLGSNLFSESLMSGQPIVNTPGTAGLGEVISNSLEMSNTDLGTEFVNMITAQRAYQSCAKVITTTDQMMAELLNIKR